MINKVWGIRVRNIRIYITFSRNCNRWFCSLTIEGVNKI